MHKQCLDYISSQNENFPVASRFLPKALQAHFAAIYCFSRFADDLADSPTLDPKIKVTQLNELRSYLVDRKIPNFVNPKLHFIFHALNKTLEQTQLPTTELEHLLTAFLIDSKGRKFTEVHQILDYCRYSATTIGRLVLALSGKDSDDNIYLSDQICIALQLINFSQDIYQDITMLNRIYMPEMYLAKFSITYEDLISQNNSKELLAISNGLVKIAQHKLIIGSKLPYQVKGLLGFELKLTVNAGLKLCNMLLSRSNSFSMVKLNKLNWLEVLVRSVFS